ncbi:MAG: ATP-binding protein [Elusimicrobia bacterium]|nr:ATP-binding protein [Elusimicrobiota bacterium]
MEIIRRFFKPPQQSFFLFGPRGTGKSLWVKVHFPHALRIDLLKLDTFRTYNARPEKLQELLEGHPKAKQVLIDEVQMVPALLSAVHSLIEQKRGLQFILTGSSARKLKRSGVDLLAGRALMKTLHPFMASELGAHFDFKRSLQQGLLPLVWSSEKPLETLKAYHGLYLREEVQMEALVRNIGNFGRFLEAVSFSQAQVLNISNIARECEVERKTVEGYLQILEDILLAVRVPVFTKKAKRELASHPKFYFFDAGIYRSLRPQGPLDRPEEIDGAALESLVFQHLRAWNAYRGEENTLSYWRTRSGVEVDIVLYGNDGLWAFEVKNTQKIRPEDLRPLASFLEDYPQAQAILLYRGHEKLKRQGVLCISCEEFLRELHPLKGIPH